VIGERAEESLSPARLAQLERLHRRTRALWCDPRWRAAWKTNHAAGIAAFRRDRTRVAAWNEKRRAAIVALYGAEPTTLEQFLARHVHPEPNTNCWLWIGFRNQSGYGQLSRPFLRFARFSAAHRVVFEAVTGHVLPAAIELHHCCRLRCCVNPAHLEPLTRSAHLQRHVDESSRGEDLLPDLVCVCGKTRGEFVAVCCDTVLENQTPVAERRSA